MIMDYDRAWQLRRHGGDIVHLWQSCTENGRQKLDSLEYCLRENARTVIF